MLFTFALKLRAEERLRLGGNFAMIQVKRLLSTTACPAVVSVLRQYSMLSPDEREEVDQRASSVAGRLLKKELTELTAAEAKEVLVTASGGMFCCRAPSVFR